jgi:ketosteroid isomerase-like protein
MASFQKGEIVRLLALFMLAVALVTSPSFGQSQIGNLSLAGLVETERAFAKTSVESGIREAFLKFFADDGIVFRPHPVVYKEAVKNVPLPQNPKAVTLNWEPIYADVSEAGDLGYTAGPYTLTDNSPERRPEQYGYFFSIWKKQLDENWRVVLDLGIQNPKPYRGPRTLESAQTIQRKSTESNVTLENQRKTLMGAERELLKSAQKGGVLMGFLNHSDNHTRLYRQGVQPIVGAESVRAYLSKKTFTQTWEPMKADVARSADLGYTYGSYEMREKISEATRLEKGYYARVWKRDAKSQWKIVFDVTSPLPPEAPKTRQ